jgi:broad specificity phosphatase PhoE
VEIVFVRHAQPAWDRDGFGVADPDLTELGLEQARHAGDRFLGVEADELLVSPLRRAQQTAEPIAKALGIEPTTVDWLSEIAAPAWDDTPTETIQRELP